MQAYIAPVHTASVNGVAFAPHELGLMLATASSDGSLSVLTYRQADGAWSPQKVTAYCLLLTIMHGRSVDLGAGMRISLNPDA